MFITRLVAITAACSLVSLPAAASPYRVQLVSDAYPAGYAPAGTHEVVVQAVPEAPAAPAPPAPPADPATEVAVIAPAPQPYADPATTPNTTTVIVTQAAEPPPPAPPSRPPPPPKRGLGLAITGWSLFGTIYVLTAWSGALIHDGHGGCHGNPYTCREVGKALMVPFIGPIMAAQDSTSARDNLSLFLLSGLQIGTFIMGVVGSVRWSRYKRWERNFAGIPLGRSGLALQPAPRLGGASLGLNYRF